MDVEDEIEVQKIEPKAIFGFAGSVAFGLIAHPDEKHLILPVGSKITAIELATNKQTFFTGHSYLVSCLDVSPTGHLLASGQISHMGFPSYVILWDWAEKKELTRHGLHKGLVQAITFTAHCTYLISLGGEDDGTIIVYDVEQQTPLCQVIASKSTSGIPTCICRLRDINNVFVVAGDQHLRIWNFHRVNKKLAVHDVNVGKIQRRYTSIRIDSHDNIIYLTTMTGDVVKVSLSFNEPDSEYRDPVAVLIGSLARHNPKLPRGKDCDKYVNGLRDIMLINDKTFLLGAGDGTVEVVEDRMLCYKNYPLPTWPNLKIIFSVKVHGAVSSITYLKKNIYLIGTNKSEIYQLNLKLFELKLLKTCHTTVVNDIEFPKDLSLVFATSSYETIRIWSTKRMQELLRIIVYNFSCSSIKFTNDGTTILSAWNDGTLRAFTPVTGKLIWAIPNSHNKGCSAITVSSNGRTIVTGGIEGQVRVWKIETLRQSLIGVLKEHSAPISTVDFNVFDTEVVSASHDGSCVIWDIARLTRKHVFYANTQFMCARYYPTGVQILSSGSNNRICFWEVYDGSLVRELEGSKTSVNCISINATGEYFVSVSNDQTVKLWDYHKGITICIGSAHSAAVVSCRYSPCGKFFVTGSCVGEVLVWNIPKEFWPKNIDPFAKTVEELKVDKTRSLGSIKKEKIDEIETKRQNKDVLRSECPTVDSKAMPDVNEQCNVIPNPDENQKI